MPNRLAQETSPYLLQHANNPVDWYAWGEEALQRAKRENLPIFLSIGYSACHWCHVMEHESFENATLAAYLNAHFVNIKVDREERPDLDQVYMTAVQLLTGRGGWPMSVFLTPALEPFFGGTYWPPEPRLGMPGFQQVLTAVTDAWTHRQEQAQAQAAQLADHIRRIGAAIADQATDLGEHHLLNAGEALDRVFDQVHGGFGNAPKFPHSMDLQVLLRIHHRAGQEKLLPMVEQTLQKMAQGGIYDHLGGGFARYSVDAKWLVPHFEKMLYDNALLGLAYLEAFQVTRRDLYAQVARETIDYVLRDLQDPSGGFHSTEDADSEGEEGKYYVWTPHEIEQVLGPERASLFCQVYDVTPQGNFEGHNILNLPRSIEQFAAEHGHDGDDLQVELARCRQQLLVVRQERIRPGKDDKILASWNGLFLETLSRAAVVLQNDLYRDHACRAAEFLQQTMRQPNGRLWHCWRQGEAKVPGFLDDYACVGNGLVTLYQATFDERWLTFATELIDIILQNFRDPAGGGYYYTPDDHEVLIARQKDYHDSSVPSSNGALATFLLRMGTLCGEPRWIAEAEQVLLSGLEVLERSPMAAGQLLIALDLWLGPRPELLMVGQRKSPTTERALRAIGKAFLPRAAIAFRNVHQIAQGGPLQRAYQGKVGATAEPWLYVCQDFQCRAPLRGLDAILAAF